jgi:hypothetical protein
MLSFRVTRVQGSDSSFWVRIPSIEVSPNSGAEGPFIYYLERVFPAFLLVNIPVSFYVNPSVNPSVKYSVKLLVSSLVNLLVNSNKIPPNPYTKY